MSSVDQALHILDRLRPRYQRRGWDLEDFQYQRHQVIEGYLRPNRNEERVEETPSSILLEEKIKTSLPNSENTLKKGWDYLHALGAEYYQIMCAEEKGTTPQNRTPRQQEIVSEIVTRTMPYLHLLALEAKTGYIEIKKGRRVTLLGSRCEQKDLIQEGMERIVSSFHAFQPEKCRISSWIRTTAIGQMLRFSGKQGLFPYLKLHWEARTLFRTHFDNEFLNAMAERAYRSSLNSRWGYERAAMLLCSLNGEYIDLWGNPDDKESNSDPLSPETFEEGYCPNEDAVTAEEYVERREMRDNLQKALERLTRRETRVLCETVVNEKTHREIAPKFGVTEQRINQIKKNALEKLGHPSNRLRKYLST
ncbi:sigma-70 family RNA polymerase sigma factor [Candidatus Woesearchaeota archaeon]|nr:sigma-70 family RNA polymerase sigma factor [Candidatus Woesearchaeota archaeon]